MTLPDPLETAHQMARTILANLPTATQKNIDDAVTAARGAVEALGHIVDADALRRRLEAEVNVFVEGGTILEDPEADHQPWLNARKGAIGWPFWDAYRDWLGRRVPRHVIRALDSVTDDILGRLENPQRGGNWDRRGMVVGQVQSGKTSNYTGLICKAADAGYPFIVVLAGVHNSLRSQTQGRLDEGFLGLDSRTSLASPNRKRAIGVGAGGRKHPPAFTLTSSDDKGDFAKGVATRVAGRIGTQPVLLVVKKHKSILTNLIEWVTQSNGQLDTSKQRMVVSAFPLLLIDDEADHASINTRKVEYARDEDGNVSAETNPTEINRLIRQLLNSFERSAFVSYTATPFANIFIDEGEREHEHGEDLFPRSFILRIPPPSNYIGPAEVFGIPAAEDPDGNDRPGLPVIRTIDDNERWLATGHKKDAVPTALPASLSEAMHAFLLTCAARAVRGQVNVHNSMLVHVTRFVDVQDRVVEQVADRLEELKEGIRGNGGVADREAVLEGFRRLWERDFRPTIERTPERYRGAPVTWELVRDALPAAAARVLQPLQINGSAGDVLTYGDHPDGVSVIAIGGDKLSRGLTLEGLTVSYYLRASRMYDTLMQMGRWFGYRDGYADLVRLYTTEELQSWYRDITIANEELGEKFDEMARVHAKPRTFSLYVRKSPAGLLVTAQTKMRSGADMELTFSDDVIETIAFDPDHQQGNRELLENFLRGQTAKGRDRSAEGAVIWQGIPGVEIAGFLERFQTVEDAKKARASLLARYIRECLAHNELLDWTAVLVNNRKPKRSAGFAEHEVGLTFRRHFERPGAVREQGPPALYRIRRLGDQTSELFDLGDDERRRADEYRAAADADRRKRELDLGNDPNLLRPLAIGPFCRQVRPATRGLIVFYLLDGREVGLSNPVPGFLISFPRSESARTISYRVPRRYWEQEAA